VALLILSKIFGSKNQRELQRLWPLVSKISAFEPELKNLSDEQLRGKTDYFKGRIEQGEELDDLLSEAFAVVREASVRATGMRHFDVQLIGGMILHSGRIAEMKTGEGKTLVATLPSYLNALSGKGVHVVTVNDYLARRDAEWMGQIFSFLGLTTGVVVNSMSSAERYKAYRSDITYGQNNEFGFDYLRDNMKLDAAEMVQRGHNFAVVDEVDSILVDEARTPLIISGPSEKPTETYQLADKLVLKLETDLHYSMDLKSKQVMLSDEGVKSVEGWMELENLYEPKNIELVHHINQALKAHVAMKRDVDYVVRNGQIMIVDEFTGRLMSGRRWSDGLHQAVEAKEGVQVQQENQTLATVTFQNYFRMYKKLSGMTGTADTEAVEFKKIYNLDVVVTPTNCPMVRQDFQDVVYSGERGKFDAVIDEIMELQKKGQPILVGTASIAKSEAVSELLTKRGVAHHVLNAKNHEGEAFIVAQAGRFGGVTISTNMAGRGTDILLGGNPEYLAAEAAGTRDPEDAEYQAQLVHFREVCAEEKQRVLGVGGLHILGTERHESRRIDNQLRGRAGRQGDPGSSRFYVSLEDDLMKRFGGERMQAIMTRVGLKEDEAIEGALVARAIENAQKKVEGFHFDIRKHLLEYDNVMNKQREVIYSQRAAVLRGDDIESLLQELIPDTVEEVIVSRANDKEPPAKWDVAGMLVEFNRNFGLALPVEEWDAKKERGDKHLAQEIFEALRDQALARYEERKQHFGSDRMVKLAQIVILQSFDHFWKDHLSNMDHLKEGIGLRGYGQKNPLQEYQREAYELFADMLSTVKLAVVQNLFIPELPSEDELLQIEQQERDLQRERSQQVKEIHEEVTPSATPGIETVEEPLAEGNRRDRRRQDALARVAPKPSFSQSDYAPTKPTADPQRDNQQRKKNKDAKKARKRR